jgi:hypothetical protein
VAPLSDKTVRLLKGALGSNAAGKELEEDIEASEQLALMVLNFNALLAKLDADGGTSNTDYAALLSV